VENRAKDRSGGGSSTRLADKSARRILAQQAASQRAAAAARRRLLTSIAGSVVAVLAVIGLVFALVAGLGNDKDDKAKDTAKDKSTQQYASSGDATNKDIPAGADPALAKQPSVHMPTGTPAKLDVKTLIEGKGAAVKAGQTIKVHYSGVSFKDGTEFDSSWKRGEPIEFPIGTGGVIPGWDKGLVGVKIGSRVQLDIPAEMAYGENPEGGRPGGPLRFVVDILGAK
jgi:peptidylprolyl isomerase